MPCTTTLPTATLARVADLPYARYAEFVAALPTLTHTELLAVYRTCGRRSQQDEVLSELSCRLLPDPEEKHP